MTKPGRYIVIEGTDGTGKSTQAELLAEKLEKLGIKVIQFHEPGGTDISQALRKVILNASLDRVGLTNVLLFSAARCENWAQQGRVALNQGTWIISARDYTSTLAYQGYGEGVDLELIENITKLATDEKYVQPDMRIILDIDDEAERVRRISERGEIENPDTFESRDDKFQQTIIDGYRDLAKRKEMPVISASQSIDAIADEIWRIVEPLTS